jgi:putative salt-induced outer membrane protein YdiY
MFKIVFSRLLVLFCLSTNLCLAETNTTKNDQQQLQSVLKKLDKATQQRQRQNTRVDELAQKLECNWTLIRAYEVCGQLHKDDPEGHLQCSTKAKQNAAQCLGDGGDMK